MALVAVLRDVIIAVGRYDRLASTDDAEVAFVVADLHQGRGIGTLLLERLAAFAREQGVTRLVAETLVDNAHMLEVFRTAGYRHHAQGLSAGVVRVVLDLEPAGGAPPSG